MVSVAGARSLAPLIATCRAPLTATGGAAAAAGAGAGAGEGGGGEGLVTGVAACT